MNLSGDNLSPLYDPAPTASRSRYRDASVLEGEVAAAKLKPAEELGYDAYDQKQR